MKANLLKSALMVILLIVCVSAYPNNDTIPSNNKEKIEAQRAEKLISRLEEIKNMDKSNLSPTEKKALRKEVKSIKKELKTTGKGVYLSVAAIIIIILLLILLI